MAALNLSQQPIDLGRRFRQALEQKILHLETNATRDEIVAGTLTDPDQIRRHRNLVQAQRDEATRLRGFLAGTRTRQEL